MSMAVSQSKSAVHILVIAENEGLANRIGRLFEDQQPTVTWRKDARRITSFLQADGFCDIVILTDNATTNQHRHDNDKLVKLVSRTSPRSQILFLAKPESVGDVVTTLESGTYQYAKQPVTDKELKLLIETALKDMSPVIEEPEDAGAADRLDNMIGRAPAMQQVYRQIKRAASSDIPVLILGETGTGKDLAAQLIHRRSSRSKKPLVSVNLGALPSDLVASELFGHEKGSFSGAIKQHHGVFERADDGTIFLDEIDCIDEKVRVSLLRVLDQKSFRRLGGSEIINTDARLIVATNADLESKVEQGEFREDLFYRLDVFRITMPPLRKRPEDIPLLVQEFVALYSRTHNRGSLSVTKEFMGIMQSYDWPGNIRELKSVIHRAVLMCDSRELSPNHLPNRFRTIQPRSATVTFDIGTPLAEIERIMVLKALEATNNNRKEAAKLLGISRRVIYNKLKKHNIT